MATLFWSGLSSVGDLEAATCAGIPAGVVAMELTANAERRAIAHLLRGFSLFVDSGAFGAFMAAQHGVGDGECDWPRVLGVVTRLSYDRGSGALLVAAPDKVGDQTRTLELLCEHRATLERWTGAGVKLLVPHQQGEMSLTEFSHRVSDCLEGIPFTPALPCKAKAISPWVAVEFVRAVRPASLHLLGAGRAQVWREAIAEIEERFTDIAVTHDANCVRAKVGAGRPLTLHECAHPDAGRGGRPGQRTAGRMR